MPSANSLGPTTAPYNTGKFVGKDMDSHALYKLAGLHSALQHGKVGTVCW